MLQIALVLHQVGCRSPLVEVGCVGQGRGDLYFQYEGMDQWTGTEGYVIAQDDEQDDDETHEEVDKDATVTFHEGLKNCLRSWLAASWPRLPLPR